MPLKKARKNAKPENRQKAIDNNIGILYNDNRSLPAAQKKSHPQIVAAALAAAGVPKKKKK